MVNTVFIKLWKEMFFFLLKFKMFISMVYEKLQQKYEVNYNTQN